MADEVGTTTRSAEERQRSGTRAGGRLAAAWGAVRPAASKALKTARSPAFLKALGVALVVVGAVALLSGVGAVAGAALIGAGAAVWYGGRQAQQRAQAREAEGQPGPRAEQGDHQRARGEGDGARWDLAPARRRAPTPERSAAPRPMVAAPANAQDNNAVAQTLQLLRRQLGTQPPGDVSRESFGEQNPVRHQWAPFQRPASVGSDASWRPRTVSPESTRGRTPSR
ncbi:hypothetical protein GCM10023220_10960 [Streptomyces ziwulingensis]|uniref:DUF3040 domain-containing protein n=1 Tax=Streptomyces ziwulingensis TaxID=1045501 RepID=A0ABP9AYZ8_9ACTN